MPNLCLLRIRGWASNLVRNCKELAFGPCPADQPPSLPFRCGTMLLRMDLEGAKRVTSIWREDENRFIAWVAAHPAPRRQWLETVERLRQRGAGGSKACDTRHEKILFRR